MANFVYNIAKTRALTGALNLESGTYRMLVLLTEDTENADHDDIAEILAAGTNAEPTDTAYARQALAYTGTTNQAGSVESDAANDRAEWHFDDATFDFDASRSPAAYVVYLDVAGDDSSDATAIPLFHWDATVSGTQIVVSNGAEGAVQAS